MLRNPSFRENAKALGARIHAELATKDPVDALLEALPTSKAREPHLSPGVLRDVHA